MQCCSSRTQIQQLSPFMRPPQTVGPRLWRIASHGRRQRQSGNPVARQIEDRSFVNCSRPNLGAWLLLNPETRVAGKRTAVRGSHPTIEQPLLPTRQPLRDRVAVEVASSVDRIRIRLRGGKLITERVVTEAQRPLISMPVCTGTSAPCTETLYHQAEHSVVRRKLLWVHNMCL